MCTDPNKPVRMCAIDFALDMVTELQRNLICSNKLTAFGRGVVSGKATGIKLQGFALEFK